MPKPTEKPLAYRFLESLKLDLEGISHATNEYFDKPPVEIWTASYLDADGNLLGVTEYKADAITLVDRLDRVDDSIMHCELTAYARFGVIWRQTFDPRADWPHKGHTSAEVARMMEHDLLRAIFMDPQRKHPSTGVAQAERTRVTDILVELPEEGNDHGVAVQVDLEIQYQRKYRDLA